MKSVGLVGALNFSMQKKKLLKNVATLGAIRNGNTKSLFRESRQGRGRKVKVQLGYGL